ncbi:ATP-binding protein [Burkholderia cepacia]|uniref:ATP-binding protein n=1 Tax=Burkholderia cepacia TaxID=292 RepID=UPI001CF50FB5|nr:ATP-binding protein [Burkholderia cepacia]MCA7893117.1 ATP-binding protein [Burkholderia cepacia]
MLIISETEILERLRFDNPWWNGEGVDELFVEMPKRFYFRLFLELIENREIRRAVVLMGPRRVGKTVMLFQAVHELLQKNIDPKSILYVSLETPLYTGLPLEKLVNIFRKENGLAKQANVHIFFDEVQYLPQWEVHLKSLVDSYPNYKFVATGSAAAALRLKSQESGAGRFTDFVLPPLLFCEYISFIGKSDLVIQTEDDNDERNYTETDIDALNDCFCDYLNFGGYPEAALSKEIQKDTGRYIRSDIIDKVLLRDLPSLYGINDVQDLNRLFTTLAYNTGNEVSLESLSKNSGVAKNTVKKYLEYLEAAFLIRRVERVDHTSRKFQRLTTFKVYLTNPSMRAALFGQVAKDSDAMGHLVETAIYSQWLHSDIIDRLYYSRWNNGGHSGEIDIVHRDDGSQRPDWAIEVKWSDKPLQKTSELDNCVYFANHNGLISRTFDNGAPILVTTKTQRKKIFTYKGIDIEFQPASIYAYLLGMNIFNSKSFPAKKITLDEFLDETTDPDEETGSDDGTE